MTGQGLIKKSLWLAVFIYIADALALKFHWYFTIWWYDMPMHFLGGLFIGLLALGIYLKYFAPPGGPTSKQIILVAFFSALVIGVLWEIFESGLNFFTLISQNPPLDTISDLSFDLAGGLFAALYYLLKNR